MAIPVKGSWNRRQLDEFLRSQQIPIRLASIGSDGFPRVLALWYFYGEEKLYCVSHQSSALVKILKKNTSVGFEVSPNEPPYFGVRGQAVANLSRNGAAEMLTRLLERYLGDLESRLAKWLLSRKEEEMLITLSPSRFHTWDYRERMTGLDHT